MGKLTLAAAGDAFIARRLPPADARAANIAALMKDCDARFVNFEMTTPGADAFPWAQSGGTWARADAGVVADLKFYGFNLVAWANNHTLDYGYRGLDATRAALERTGLVHAGVGEDLAEADSVRYLECRGGRVALVAAASTFHESWMAGEARRDARGRPGLNPLRFSTTYRVSEERMGQLRDLACATGINARRELSQKEGFTAPDAPGNFGLGPHLSFEVGAPEGEMTRPHAGDLERILNRVREARRGADVVLVSIHAHEMAGAKERPAQFLTTFARRCIDEGADAVLGHGPHIVRGIELYRSRPIFYSLGNFIFQNESVERQPAAFYEKYGLGAAHNVADAYAARAVGAAKGLTGNPDVWRSIIARCTWENGQLKEVLLHPLELGFGLPRHTQGWPQLSAQTEVLEQLRARSGQWNTEIQITNGIGRL